MGESTAPPYTFNWNNVPAGSYTLTAVAWDNAGLHTTAAPVIFTVVSVAPPPPETPAAPASSAAPKPLHISQHFDLASQRLLLTWPNATGSVYRVVFKESLDQPGWTDLTEDISAEGPTAAWQIPVDTAAPHRFFGVKVMP